MVEWPATKPRIARMHPAIPSRHLVIARAGLLTAEDLAEFRVYIPDDGSGPPLLTSEAT